MPILSKSDVYFLLTLCQNKIIDELSVGLKTNGMIDIEVTRLSYTKREI